MPAKSVAQQQFMGICEHNPAHARGKCPNMSKAELHKFAATSTKGLPQHVAKRHKGGLAGAPKKLTGQAKRGGFY